MPKCGSYGSTGRRSGCIDRKPAPLFEDGENEVAEVHCQGNDICPKLNKGNWECVKPYDPFDPEDLGLQFPYEDESLGLKEDGTSKKGPRRGIRTRKERKVPKKVLVIDPAEPGPSKPAVVKIPMWRRIRYSIHLFISVVYTTLGNNIDSLSSFVSSIGDNEYYWSIFKSVSLNIFGLLLFTLLNKAVSEKEKKERKITYLRGTQ